MTSNQPKTAIIGAGNFGSFLHQELKENSFKSDILDKNLDLEAFQKEKYELAILCTPIHTISTVAQTISYLLPQEALLLDTASVKLHPQEVFQSLKPKKRRTLLTHPLFGTNFPTKNRTTIVCSNLNQLPPEAKSLFQHLKTTPQFLSAEDHDKEMANQALTHLAARALHLSGFEPKPPSTSSSKKLFELTSKLVTNSPELLEDMIKFNPYARAAAENFHNQVASLLQISPR